jgi:hypothetical protein
MRRGDATTNWTRGTRGDGSERGMMRGGDVMRDGGARRWVVVA